MGFYRTRIIGGYELNVWKAYGGFYWCATFNADIREWGRNESTIKSAKESAIAAMNKHKKENG